MAIYHLTTRTGKAHQGRAVRHGDYIRREGIYAERKDLVFLEFGSLPSWAADDPAEFWHASDELERANGRAYREIEVAIPRELSREQQIELVRQYCREQFGNRHAYEVAIHDKGDGNPHAHIMFSERQLDGIERDRTQFFMRANKKNPERGGCVKDDAWRGTKRQKPPRLLEARARWADLQNIHLECAGELARVDHRTLKAQGIEREAQIHVGPRTAKTEVVHEERHKRNEAIKLVNQKDRAMAEFVAAQTEIAEITATLKELEVSQQKAQEKGGLSDVARVWFAWFDRETWKPRGGSRRILSREEHSPEVQARISLEMPPKCVLSEDGRAWVGVFRDPTEAVNYGREKAAEIRRGRLEKESTERLRTQEDLKHAQETTGSRVGQERPQDIRHISQPVVTDEAKARFVGALQALLAAEQDYKASFRAPRQEVAERMATSQRAKARCLELAKAAARDYAAVFGPKPTLSLAKERLGREKFDLAREFETVLGLRQELDRGR